ncbi:YdcF family protein [Aquibium microcysteis]|uniref:YdcF family protein n=1 Tax=Aquibium microcysteis TaxID=675281 RepID=UPI00165D00DF|nr:YdcF family protein [Aquibium microcysteis]
MNSDRADKREFRLARLGWLSRTIFAVSAVAGLAFVAGFGLFADRIGRLETPSDPPGADAIIVLTGGQFRLDAAVELLRSGKGQRLLISGVNPVARDSELKAVMGADDRLFSCCIDIDRAAIDTVGNAAESAKWVNEHAYTSIILVTNNYHMPRSLLEMRRLLKTTDVRPYPVVNSRLDDGSWLVKPDAVRVLFTEYTKFLTALARSPFAGGPEQAAQTRSANAR